MHKRPAVDRKQKEMGLMATKGIEQQKYILINVVQLNLGDECP